MKTLTLKKIKLVNFKKIDSLEIEFKDKTQIFADNGVGKTTIFDAFTWCLFGKDSLGKTDFEIKKLDDNNVPVSKKEHSVECSINDHVIKRVYREKWTKKRGSEFETFDGHETVYEINGGVYQQKQFKEFIESIIDENVFRLLTSRTYFQSLKWEERRKILYSLVQDLSDSQLAEGNDDFKKLIDYISGKSFEQFRTDLKAKISPIKKELERLTGEIEGTSKNIPDDINVESLKKELETLGDPNSINTEIIKERLKIESEIEIARQKHLAQYEPLRKSQHEQKIEIQEKTNQEKEFALLVEKYTKRRTEILAEYNAEKAKEFSHTCCSECGVDTFEIQNAIINIPELQDLFEKLSSKNVDSEEDFKKKKAKKLEEILKNGTNNTTLKTNAEIELESIRKWLSEISLIEFKEEPFDDTELRAKMPKLKEIDTELVEKIKAINEKIGGQKVIEEMKLSLQSAIDKQKELSKSLASLERTQFQCEKFAKYKSDIFVEKINSLFTFVKFKLFEKQVNGGEVECCETLVNGVPYSTNLNSGAKVNAEIDILNVLSKSKDTFCPMFLDNMESCTEPIEPCSQSIFLYVDKQCKTLTIK